ncbi:MAG TPA: NCS2 family permease [Candidatus Obscuribacterales bacterium]
MAESPSLLERHFKLSERGSTLRTELLGGATTFMTMAYIIVVNPAILSFAGFPVEPATVATIVTAVFGCLLMGLYANRPLAVAPYMGENAFIAFGLAALGISWQQRLGAVFVSGLAFALLSVLRIRPWLANSISESMKHSFACGIGLFLALIGMYETGIITSAAKGMAPAALLDSSTGLLKAPPVPLKIGDLHQPAVLLAILGFLITVALLYRKTKGAILLGIIITAALGYVLGLGEAPKAVVALPFTPPYTLEGIAFKLDVLGVLKLSFLPILLTLFLMSFLDTLGTLVGVGAAGQMLDERGNFIEVEKPMMVDAASCVFSAVVGSSTSGAYIESAAGVREGARTGIAAIVTGALFALSIFFIPLLEPLQHLTYAYAPALMAVGLLMVNSITKIDMDDLTEAMPAFATIAMMIFSYNIANGLTAGLVLYSAIKICTGRFKELNSGSLVLSAMCLIYFIFGLPH